MILDVKKYAFINAKLRARISKIPDAPFYDRLLRAKNLPEAMGLLKNTSYTEIYRVYEKTGDLKMAEKKLLEHEIDLFVDIQKYVDGDLLHIVRALSLRFEIENVKNAIRLFFDQHIRGRSILESGAYLVTKTVVHDINFDRMINANNFIQIRDLLQHTPYAKMINDTRQSVEQKKSLFDLEIGLDRYFYRNLFEKLDKLSGLDKKYADRLLGVEVDLQNIAWLVRFRDFYKFPASRAMRYLIPRGYNLSHDTLEQAYAGHDVTFLLKHVLGANYAGLSTMLSAQESRQTSRLAILEQVLDKILSIQVKRVLSGYPFTIGILLSYFILKSNEMKKLKTILNAKQYKLANERVQGLL